MSGAVEESSDEISDSEELEDLAPCEEDEEDVEEELNYSDDYEKEDGDSEERRRKKEVVGSRESSSTSLPSRLGSSSSLPSRVASSAGSPGRPSVEPARLRPARSSAPAYPRGYSLAPRPPRTSSSRTSTRTSTLTPSLASMSPSSLSHVMGHRRRQSHLQQRVNSAKRKSDNELRNAIGAMQIQFQELQEENRTLRRQIARQERDLSKYSGPEGDLPVILRAHNEETRVLKSKVKQVQDNNKQLARHLKEKHQQVKDLLHRQDILEKSHRQQLIMEVKKKKEVKKQLAATEERVKTLESMVMEKDKLINRLHIYSRRQGERGAPTTMRGSVENIDNILSRLDQRLQKFSGADKRGIENEEEAKNEETKSNSPDEPPKAVQAFPESPSPPKIKPASPLTNEDSVKHETGETKDDAVSFPTENGKHDKEAFSDSGDEEPAQYSGADTDSEASNKSPSLPSPPSPTDRQNRAPSASSFRSKKAFFEELGPFKVRELSARSRQRAGAQEEDGSGGVPGPQEKVALWLPSTKEPAIDSGQKAKLLAQLKAIDGDAPYSPSFGSPAASVSSQESGVKGRKASITLMNELFGDETSPKGVQNKFAVTKPVLKSAKRSTTPGSGKTVKFYEEEVKQTETRGGGHLVANGI